jgi:hypothetical protein
MDSHRPVEPGDYQYTLKWQDLERTDTVHVPLSYDGKKSVPLVVVFRLFPSDVRTITIFSVR